MSIDDRNIAAPLAASGDTRFHALDCLRAAAMLAGVYYHALLFAGMGGGPMAFGGPDAGFGPRQLQDWLHSFRMPLFFLISGFFCRMMFLKYGWRRYLAKRYLRIGLPLIIGLFTFVPLYHLAFDSVRASGPGPANGPRGFNGANFPAPPPGFVPPPLIPFDVNKNGSLDADEWDKARKMLASNGPPPGGFLGGPASQRPQGAPGGPFGGPMFSPPGPVSSFIFGANVRYFTLSHLWFLWYLLVFATAAPVVAIAGAYITRPMAAVNNRWGARAIAWAVAPLLLGLLSWPALLLVRGFGGSPLGLAAGIGRGFPDFAWHLEWDMPFYFAYFVSGWWLHQRRDSLRAAARAWAFMLVVGLVGHYAAAKLSGTSATGVYAIGSAYTACGFVGLFQCFLNRPTRIGRHLGDTAFWIYLSHQALLAPFLSWLRPFDLPWYINGLAATALTSVTALLMYESFVRPTALGWIFGPGSPNLKRSDSDRRPPEAPSARDGQPDRQTPFPAAHVVG